MKKYTEINPLGDTEPVEVEPYVSEDRPLLQRLDGTPTEPRREPRRRAPGALRPRKPRRRESHRQRPGHRRVRASRAGPDDDADADAPAVEPWRWASNASWSSFVASIQARDFEREIARERWNGVAR